MMPISTVLNAIVKIVMTRAGLRPLTSPSQPMAMLPTGRPRKPTPNTAKDRSSELSGSVAGKNAFPIIAAMNP